MKKKIILILSFLLMAAVVICSVIMGIAAGEEDGIPDDAFEGKYVEYRGKDGSVTTVYDNGSVTTVHADGSKEGVDYMGNQYLGKTDGTNVIRTTDGSVATEYSDGRRSLTEPDGKTTTFYKDGHMTEEYKSLGLVVEYNSDLEQTGIGFIGSDERIKYDESGFVGDGTVKGPGGATLTVKDGNVTMKNQEGKTIDATFSPDGDKITITHPDGSKATSEVERIWGEDESGNTLILEKTVGEITYPDGTRYDMNSEVTFDKNRNPIASSNNVSLWTGSDGTKYWTDHNSKAWTYVDPNADEIIRIDKNGNIREFKAEGHEWNITYDKNGVVETADIRYRDGSRIVVENGASSYTLPDGTVYSSDGKGNVFRNDEQIKKDGEWLLDPDRNNPDAGKIKIGSADIVGTWSVTSTISDVDSPLVDGVKSFFDGIFGEGAGDDIVTSDLGPDGSASIQETVVIEEEGSSYRVTMYPETGGTYVYTGKLSGNVLRLKLVSSPSYGGALQVDAETLDLTFVKKNGEIVIDGTYDINNWAVKAKYTTKGTKVE